MKGRTFFLIEWMLILDMDLPSLSTMLMLKPHPWTYRMSYGYYSILHSIVLHQGTYFSAKSRSWAYAHGIHWAYHGPHPPEATGLIEWWKDL